MKVLPPRRNTSLSQTTIIPEINKEHGLGSPKVGEPLPHPIPLLRSRHQGKIGLSPNGNVMKVPEKETPLLHQKIDKGIARQNIRILGSLCRRDSKEDPGLFEPIHHLHHSTKHTPASSRIGLFSEPLEADRWNHIAQYHKLIDHLFIDQGRIGIDLKHHIPMLFEKVKKVFPQKWLSPRHQNQMDAHLFTFSH